MYRRLFSKCRTFRKLWLIANFNQRLKIKTLLNSLKQWKIRKSLTLLIIFNSLCVIWSIDLSYFDKIFRITNHIYLIKIKKKQKQIKICLLSKFVHEFLPSPHSDDSSTIPSVIHSHCFADCCLSIIFEWWYLLRRV